MGPATFGMVHFWDHSPLIPPFEIFKSRDLSLIRSSNFAILNSWNHPILNPSTFQIVHFWDPLFRPSTFETVNFWDCPLLRLSTIETVHFHFSDSELVGSIRNHTLKNWKWTVLSRPSWMAHFSKGPCIFRLDFCLTKFLFQGILLKMTQKWTVRIIGDWVEWLFEIFAFLPVGNYRPYGGHDHYHSSLFKCYQSSLNRFLKWIRSFKSLMIHESFHNPFSWLDRNLNLLRFKTAVWLAKATMTARYCQKFIFCRIKII